MEEDLETSENVQLHLCLASSGERGRGGGGSHWLKVIGEGNWIMEEIEISNNESCLAVETLWGGGGNYH